MGPDQEEGITLIFMEVVLVWCLTVTAIYTDY
jgi:hypothetical protein